MGKFFLWLGIFIMYFSSYSVYAQTEIKGTVTDEQNMSIPGANVTIKGSSNGTITDVNGNYSINAKAGDVLIFSFIGYKPQEVEINNQTEINVILQEETTDIDEVVVVGYGVQKKSLNTGAISSVKSEDLQNTPVSRADQAIQGKTAGVSILSNSGSPGAGAQIRIRGVNSNGNSNPLFIVDGMKTGDINNIDPSDIESMEVLKDAASAAIYGTEGANGVIIITTKSGEKGNGTINYDFQYGIQSSRSKMKMMNAQQYQQWAKESGAGTVKLTGIDTDWLNEVFQTAPMQKHHISFANANEKSSYMLSGSYFAQDGIVGGDKSNYERLTARINGKSDVKKWLQIGSNLSYSHSKQHYIGEDSEYTSLVNSAMLIDPLTPVFYLTTPAKVTNLLANGKTLLKNSEGKYYGLPEYATGEISNPFAVLDSYHNEVLQDKFLGTAYATLKPIKGLNITSRIGLDLTYQTSHTWTPKYYFTAERQNAASSVDDNINKWYTWLWENYASYNLNIENHDITVLLGYSAQKYQAPNFSMHSAPLIKEGDDFAYQGYTTSNEFDRTGGGFVDQTMTSIFGRVSYNYLHKYMFEASLRRDAASVFPTNDRSGIFPALSAGWVISEEGFFNVKYIDYLKLRASWGQNGSKANLPGNEDKSFWIFSGIQYPDATDQLIGGAKIAKLTNPNLTWEKTDQIDIGLDIRALNGKLSLGVDYYNKKTKDLIVVGTGPLSVGNNYPFINGGTVTNKGFDFEIAYRNHEGEFKYGINLNLSTINNEVTELKVDVPVAGLNLRGHNLTWFQEGYPIWYFKGYKTDGINTKTGEPIVVDVNGDKNITPEDMTYIGDPHPDFIYGATVNLRYKYVDFNLFVQGVSGNDVFMGFFRSDRAFSNKPEFMFNDRWTTNNTNASMPKANNASDFVYRSDLMVQNGSYLRIKQIQLGFNFPKDIIDKAKLSKARVFVSLNDFFTFTKYRGLDPEAGSSNNTSQGVDKGMYPIAGKLLFGCSISF